MSNTSGDPNLSRSQNSWFLTSGTQPNWFAPQGWICPKCGHVWSPSMPGCGNCNHVNITISAPTTEPLIDYAQPPRAPGAPKTTKGDK